jgi:hypothetical protein
MKQSSGFSHKSAVNNPIQSASDAYCDDTTDLMDVGTVKKIEFGTVNVAVPKKGRRGGVG